MYNISEVTLGINDRFFQAVAVLKQKKLLGGINGFSRKYGVVLGNLYTIKTQKKGAVKAEYLHYLVEDFFVSADWLLTGRGDMFTDVPTKAGRLYTK